MRKLISGVVAALLLAGMPALALAEAAGSAKGVKPAADAERDGTIETLVVGSDIFIGDLVETGPKGQVQILFADNTELVVGPHSSLKVEDYLIRNDGSAGRLVVNMLAGSFRFATGDSAKNRYELNTPTGTIGVRGTGFDSFIDRLDGTTRILHYHGIVHFCSLSNVCEDLSELCTLGEFDSGDARVVGDTRTIKGDARAQLKGEFIYAGNQGPLLRQFWMANSYDCLHNPPAGPLIEDSGTDDSGPGKPPPTPTPRPPPPIIIIP
ncbi:MAG: FecR family protein [Devosia sp.]|nr:FecR family protein [Devosia sp.]